MIKLDVSLKTYKNQVGNGTIELPSYADCCPICKGKDCPGFNGYYYRKVIDEKGTYFKEFPIARFKCKGKGNKKLKGKTFSLLPDKLIPYVKYSNVYLLSILLFWLTHSIKETLDKVSTETEQPMCSKSLYYYRELFEIALDRLLFAGLLKNLSYEEFLDYNIDYQSSYYQQIRGSPALALDYYIFNGIYLRNSWFLFGVAWQFR